ncbi:MAG: hypothetical protein HQK65_13450 [Desulfamplus sp.]|nr:hypothetical protein [Desulfamplus sp.]
MKKLGALPPKYNFALNPYPDSRFFKCPNCNQKTGQRKLPLLIHVDPKNLIALNYTNKYCTSCDLLIAHRHEIEHHLTELFRQSKPEVIGNSYLVMGTAEKKAWRENIKNPKPFEEMMQHISDFISHQEIQMTMGGWYMDGEESQLMQPAPSTEWVKG